MLLAANPPAVDFEAALAEVSPLQPVFVATYLNAGLLITIQAALLMAGLYGYTRSRLPEWLALAGLVFSPVYATLNLVVYLSQVTVLPLLAGLYTFPETQPAADVLLRLAFQELPGSGMAFLNGLAYAALGIPSLAFGEGLRRMGGALRAAGLLLGLSGAASLLGFLGAVLHIPGLDLGVAAGGGLFLLALIPMAAGFYQDHP